MEDIRKTFTIQWVGPFRDLAHMRKYLNDKTTCDKTLFSFYYFYGNKKGQGYAKSLFYSYFGIHKKIDGIEKRLSNYHEHFSKFQQNENLRIWIGAFGNAKDQKERNIEDAETLFIRTYKSAFLTENRRKLKSEIKESICIINLFYKEDETPWLRKPSEIQFMDDVMIHESEEKISRTLVAKLRPVKWE